MTQIHPITGFHFPPLSGQYVTDLARRNRPGFRERDQRALDDRLVNVYRGRGRAAPGQNQEAEDDPDSRSCP